MTVGQREKEVAGPMTEMATETEEVEAAPVPVEEPVWDTPPDDFYY